MSYIAPSEPWETVPGVAGYAWKASNPRAIVLLQHGYAEYASRFVEHYAKLIPHLVGMGISVYAIDMRGHGGSVGPKGAVDINVAVEDHLAARRLLEATGHPLFLFGHSLGGLVTATSVLRRSNHLAGVILSSPALWLPSNPFFRFFVGALAKLVPLRAAVRQGDSRVNTRREDLHAVFAADPLLYRGPLPMVLASSALSVSHGNRKRYGTWTTPTLALHGTSDTATDPRGSELLIAQINSADRRLVLVQDGRHELLNDIGSDETLGTILLWIDERID